MLACQYAAIQWSGLGTRIHAACTQLEYISYSFPCKALLQSHLTWEHCYMLHAHNYSTFHTRSHARLCFKVIWPGNEATCCMNTLGYIIMGWSLQITQLHKCMVSGLLTLSYSIQQWYQVLNHNKWRQTHGWTPKSLRMSQCSGCKPAHMLGGITKSLGIKWGQFTRMQRKLRYSMHYRILRTEMVNLGNLSRHSSCWTQGYRGGGGQTRFVVSYERW